MATLVLTIKTELSQTHVKQLALAESASPKLGAALIRNFIQRTEAGIERTSIDFQTSSADPLPASGTITCASVSVNDTVTIGKTTLTAKAAPANENEFDQSGTDTADAVSLAAKINAHSVLSKLVSATSALGVVTVTSLVKGSVANYIALSSSNGTRLAVTGSGYLASGAGGIEEASVNYGLGL